MNTFIWTGILMAALFAVTGSARKIPIAEVGSKTFFTIEGKTDFTWAQALQACKKEGLRMAVIKNRAESQAISDYLSNLSEESSSNGGLTWLGAHLKNGKWIWASTGEELTYKNWRRDAVLDNPGDSPTNGYGCGYMNSGTLKWGTWACGAENAMVICQ